MPESSAEDPLHRVVLKGLVDPKGGTVQVWFEWGTDPNLTTYQTTDPQTVSGNPTQVKASINISIGVKYYYRIASHNVKGHVIDFTNLLGDPRRTSNPKWSIYDRIIDGYASQYRIPATVLKAVLVQESSLNRRAFRYEPLNPSIVEKQAYRVGPYLLPDHPPSDDEYPREYNRNAPWQDDTPMVRLPADITMGDLWDQYHDKISMSKPPQKYRNERAQWRLTSSYGLGQFVYIYQGDKINWARPEGFYDVYLNIEATARNLSNPNCQGDFSDFSLEGMSRAVLQHNWGSLPCKFESVVALRAYCQNRWCSRSDLWAADEPAYLVQVREKLSQVQPALVPGVDTRSILPPPSGGAGLFSQLVSTLQAGEMELDRLIADLKGTGQLQLAVLYGIREGTTLEGLLRIFADTEGNSVEWESPRMPGISEMGTVYTQALRAGGAPLIVASWGVGAHGMIAYFFRWQDGQFRAIPLQEGETIYFGAFADGSISVGDQDLQVAQRGLEEPLAVTVLSVYSWQPERATFVFERREILSPIPFRIYIPLIMRGSR
jgi:hypothetical protein